MYKIPLTNSPNQKFSCTVPVNGENKSFVFKLWYNYVAKYWLLTLIDQKTEKEIFVNLPLLSSNGNFYNILFQLDYLRIGICVMLPTVESNESAANENNLGKTFVMIWGDNDE